MLLPSQPGSGQREQLGEHQAGTPVGTSSCRGGAAQAEPRAVCAAALPSLRMGSKLGSVSPSSSSHRFNPGSLPLALWSGVLFEVNTPHSPCPVFLKVRMTVKTCEPLPCSLWAPSAFSLSCLLSSVRLGSDPSYVPVLAECLAL